MNEAEPIAIDTVKLAHSSAFVDTFCSGELTEQAQKAIGFPWSPEFVHRTRVITGATLAATKHALLHPGGVAGNLAGGTHHAFADRGEGYCIFNDLAVAAQWALHAGQAKHVAVVDLDVHQGNGTASMLEHVAGTSTLSVHADKNYPWKTRHPSDVDVAVPDSVTAQGYLQAVRSGLQQLETHWETAGLGCPDLVLFQAGVDPLKHDRLGRLKLTRSDLHDRNECVYEWISELETQHGVNRIPLVVTMGGGYSVPIEHSARAHVDVFSQAAELHFRRLAHITEAVPKGLSNAQHWAQLCKTMEEDSKLVAAANYAVACLHSSL